MSLALRPPDLFLRMTLTSGIGCHLHGSISKKCFGMSTQGSSGTHVHGVKLLQQRLPSNDASPAMSILCTAMSV